MKAAVRCESLDLAGLARAEKHGKREDWIGKQRKIRNVKPLVLGGLDLTALYEKHTEGARQNKAARKPVLHFIVRFPPEVLTDDGPTPYAQRDRAGRERLMVSQAVKFINETHGGEAVFAARLDRDEAGESVVDVFACPRYLKESKAGREPALWTSATKFGEELARKHQKHIRERMKDAKTAKAITSPRAVGMAIQESFGQFFERQNGVKLDPRKLKEGRAKDRLEVEEWRVQRMAQEAAKARQERDKAHDEAAAARAVQEEAAAEADAARQDVEAAKAAAAAVVQDAEAEAAKVKAAGKAEVKADRQQVADTLAGKLAEVQTLRAAAAKDRAEAKSLRETAKGLLDKVEEYLRRPDLPDLARKAGAVVLKTAGRAVPEPDATSHGGGGSKMRRMAGLDAAPPASAPAPQSRPEARHPAPLSVDRSDDFSL